MPKTVFEYCQAIVDEYCRFSRSFTKIKAEGIKKAVDEGYENGRYWPKPLIQINPNYKISKTVDELCDDGTLHADCRRIFRIGKDPSGDGGKAMSLFCHQAQAVGLAQNGDSYVVTTGTGSGKSLSFFIPIVNAILRAKAEGKAPGTSAIIIYPMNALANSQLEEIDKFRRGCESTFTVARYTGQESDDERKRIADNPPDILLTNYMMMELILTRGSETDRKVMRNCHGLRFLVLDELHTYRGRQGADVALLVRRLRRETEADKMVCIGTSATMDNTGSEEDQINTVARVASKLFGAEIKPSNVITETLAQATDERLNLAKVKPMLKARLEKGIAPFGSIEEFRKDPLSVWVELTLGIDKPDSGKAKRAKPMTLGTAAKKLAEDAGIREDEASDVLKKYLMEANALADSNGRKPFAFKLHQFISGPGNVLCTLDAENKRLVTLDAQVFAPGREDGKTRLFNTYFCRECGEEFFPVRFDEECRAYMPRNIGDMPSEESSENNGFLVPIKPDFKYKTTEDLPESWWGVDKHGSSVIRKDLKQFLPISRQVLATGECCTDSHDGTTAFYYIPGKVRFCPCCGYEYEPKKHDRNKLVGLSGEGRSSATTVLTLAALNQLYADNPYGNEVADDVRKMLGFTDNRQDAALQAGHFNDFIFAVSMRAALLSALEKNDKSLSYDELAGAVFKALGFDSRNKDVLKEFMVNPKMDRPDALDKVKSEEKFVIGYRLMDELGAGWRNNNPPLEMLGLLHIGYKGLDELCADDSKFAGNEALVALSPDKRRDLFRAVFDVMKKRRCVDSIYLKRDEQQRVQEASYRDLLGKWGFEEGEQLNTYAYVDDSGEKQDPGRGRRDYSTVSVGRNSLISRAIKNSGLWAGTSVETRIKESGNTELIRNIVTAAFEIAQSADIVHKTQDGWQLHANAMEWRLGKDPNSEPVKTRGNDFFEQLYNEVKVALGKAVESDSLCSVYEYEAHEHTAQVDAQDRKTLERRFRYTEKDRNEWKEERHDVELKRLPVLYCSPTMELGVDISSLNTVYMRNVPPTASNYAQRSGRAGRSGQPALVLTYSSSMSPHDQWFFKKSEDMVSGIVNAPTLDITNKDLVTSHIHAVWLQELDYDFGQSIYDNVMDAKSDSRLEINAELKGRLADESIKTRAKAEAKAILAEVRSSLSAEEREQPWVQDTYADHVLDNVARDFDAAFDAWRTLYRSIRAQMDEAHKISTSPSVSEQERKRAERRHQDAQQQFGVLLGSGGKNLDFYPYRYLASQGFLPGYDFPRLPLMAWIPSARGGLAGKKEDAGSMVSRPRFLAISEFGPQSVIYHEGRRYKVWKAKLNAANGQASVSERLATRTMAVCGHCGYGHEGANAELCERCGQPLAAGNVIDSLYRIETVETKPSMRISADEEERLRKGYDLLTVYRFASDRGLRCRSKMELHLDGDRVGELTYGPNANLSVFNLGWRKRKNMSVKGFEINPMTGRWETDPGETEQTEQDEKDDSKVRPQRIVPFVEDTKNILVFEPMRALFDGSAESKYSKTTMATLSAALQRAIEEEFQIEQSELAVRQMPNDRECTSLLFYEASEGGAGVLTELVRNEKALGKVARRALALMHYSWEGSENGVSPKSVESLIDGEAETSEKVRCIAGCYRCLLSYYNQPLHEVIDRRDNDALEILVNLANASVDKVETPADAVPVADAPEKSLDGILDAVGCVRPDAYDKEIMGGAYRVLALWKTYRFVLLESAPDAELDEYLSTKGFRRLVVGSTPEEQERVLNENKAQLPGCEDDL